ncbi:hypothetical protein OG369_10075 [Streptomyces sp. NBC_01221]|uniref:hypothetical protein n=1 Tax=Streptomyces sp. NBC_01221 TaxID=2903782 RepID=UPI00224D6547|nr:hypothetical protein [Streptomyces sp. NBC_01221]MCX4786519.1 hypothetical protein [Streptomyces sp. NBC_01221]
MTAPLTPQRESEIRAFEEDEHRNVLTMGRDLDDLLAELDRVRAELAEQKRVAKHSAGRAVFLRSELATRPSRTELLTVLGRDVETAIAPLKGEARKGADMVLRAIREMAAEPTVPTVVEATS